MSVRPMKNVQFIDSADNCTFSVFQATEDEFDLIFPGSSQDIQFSEDLSKAAAEAMRRVGERPVRKPDAMGIHGTLFFEFERKRHNFPATKRERDWNPMSISEAQRRLYGTWQDEQS